MNRSSLVSPDKRALTAFYSDLATKNLGFMRIHHAAGQIAKLKGLDDPYEETTSWRRPTQHCLVEAAGSIVLARLLKLSPSDTSNLFVAALVHDANKRPEIEALKKAESEGKSVNETDAINDKMHAISKQRLKDANVSEESIRLTEAVAHTSLDQFVHLNSENEMTINEQVAVVGMAMHYLDDITRDTDMVSIDTRMDRLEELAATKYPYNSAGRVIWGGRTYFEAQREAGHLIESELATIANIDNPRQLPDIINQELVKLVMSAQVK